MEDIFKKVLQGIIPNNEEVIEINNTSVKLIEKSEPLTPSEINTINIILHICNTIYNCTDTRVIEDGIYDLLLEKYKKYDSNYQVGSEEIQFTSVNKQSEKSNNRNLKVYMHRLPKEKEKKMMFADELISDHYSAPNGIFYKRYMTREQSTYINKRTTDNSHKYPKLSGTLDKAKFVMNYQAEEKGVINDSNIQILERDFFQKHIQMGILDPNRIIRVLLEIKYDGLSAIGEVNTKIDFAESRGDTNNDKATDLTPILKGYRFPNAPKELWKEKFGMKFEAIITNNDLETFNRIKGYGYKNNRTGVIGLFSGSDAYKYQDLITLVPLATSLEGVFKDRVEEIEFLNSFYATKVPLKYAVIEGNLTSILYQIKRFVEEAEYMRPYMGFMYDGVVVSYLDQDIIDNLPRQNSVNKHSIAVKFNPLKKSSIVREIKYTVGQDGVITPMVYYDPVEFFGTIHPKSSIHSYKRFKNLELRIGSMIELEYVGDVMPYITKPDNHYNSQIDNNIPPLEYIDKCPICGTKLKPSKTGKTMICDNISCQGRDVARMVNLVSKLNIKDFGESNIIKINKFTLTDMLKITKEELYEAGLGEKTTEKFLIAMNQLMTEPIKDYEIIGALGFDSIAKEKWKKILNKFTLSELMFMEDDVRYVALCDINGIGPETASMINNRWEFFLTDLVTIMALPNVIKSKGGEKELKVRMTGFRNKDLVALAKAKGIDLAEGSVTKDTDILLVPGIEFSSTKTNKAQEYGIKIMTADEFKEQYIL